MDAFEIDNDNLRILLEEASEEARKLLVYEESEPVENREARFPYPIANSDIVSILKKSEKVLPGFATLDYNLATAISKVLKDLQDYIDDKTRRRPHNLLMMAEPGSGKSYLVDCLVKSLKVPQVVGNLSTPDSVSVLTYVANEARNFKAQDLVPLIFLDEVDSYQSHYATLLPLLWDGEIFVLGQVMKLGRCIMICAVSKRNLEAYLEHGEPNLLTKAADSLKVPDFLSRFDAGILGIDSINSEGRNLDKLVITAKLIGKRFPEAKYVSVGLLQFFSYLTVEHEVRSLEFLVNLIPSGSVQALPSNSRGKYLIKPNEGFLSLSQTWNRSLLERFTHLLRGEGEFTDLLRFHFSDQNRKKAEQVWHLYVNNIGLLRLNYD